MFLMQLTSFPMVHMFREPMPLEQIAERLMENDILLGRLGEVLESGSGLLNHRRFYGF